MQRKHIEEIGCSHEKKDGNRFRQVAFCEETVRIERKQAGARSMVEKVFALKQYHIVHFELGRVQSDMKMALRPAAGKVVVVAVGRNLVERKAGPKKVKQNKTNCETAK